MPKKNFRKIPPPIRRQLQRISEQYIVAGCSSSFLAEEISSGKLSHLNIGLTSSGLEIPQSIVPPEDRGKYSNRNVNGYEVIRKDLEKETHYNVVDAPNWGNFYNGSHSVFLPYEKYPRDFYAPQLSEIKINSPNLNPGQPNYLLVFEVDRVLDRKNPNFEHELLECLNILQENVGACGVQKSGANISDYMKTISVSWEVLPPGTKEEAVARIFGKRKPSPQERSVVEGRYSFLMGLKPMGLVYGLSGIQRYFGAQIEDDLVVFENIEYGNAIYIMYEDWKGLSMRTRTELLSGRYGKNFDRVTHVSGWKKKVKKLILDRQNPPRK